MKDVLKDLQWCYNSNRSEQSSGIGRGYMAIYIYLSCEYTLSRSICRRTKSRTKTLI